MAELHGWADFYVIVGAGSAALIGLQFIFLSLLADTNVMKVLPANAAFNTPTLVHFSAVLLTSSLISAPWKDIQPLTIFLGITGSVGILYLVYIIRFMIRAYDLYQPVLEDWAFHIITPFIAYSALIASVIFGPPYPHETMFVIGFATLALLFTGIHNSWDSAVYFIFKAKPNLEKRN